MDKIFSAVPITPSHRSTGKRFIPNHFSNSETKEIVRSGTGKRSFTPGSGGRNARRNNATPIRRSNTPNKIVKATSNLPPLNCAPHKTAMDQVFQHVPPPKNLTGRRFNATRAINNQTQEVIDWSVRKKIVTPLTPQQALPIKRRTVRRNITFEEKPADSRTRRIFQRNHSQNFGQSQLNFSGVPNSRALNSRRSTQGYVPNNDVVDQFQQMQLKGKKMNRRQSCFVSSRAKTYLANDEKPVSPKMRPNKKKVNRKISCFTPGSQNPLIDPQTTKCTFINEPMHTSRKINSFFKPTRNVIQEQYDPRPNVRCPGKKFNTKYTNLSSNIFGELSPNSRSNQNGKSQGRQASLQKKKGFPRRQTSAANSEIAKALSWSV